jgi:hypothetical protein
MKPHPRIRKTIKWGGAAVTLLLVVVWIGSALWRVSWGGKGSKYLVLGAGRFGYVAGVDSDTGVDRLEIRANAAGSEWAWQVGFAPTSTGDMVFCLIPLWIPTLVFSCITAPAWYLDAFDRRARRGVNLCPKCNHDRAGIRGVGMRSVRSAGRAR